MKKLLLFISASLITTWAISQNCETTLPSTVKVKKVNGSHVQDADAIWICENLTFDIVGTDNTVYVEKGGTITITGNNQKTVFVKYPGSLIINSNNNLLFKVDSGVVVTDNGTGNTIDTCFAIKPVIFKYDNITGIIDCIDTSTVGISAIHPKNNIKLYPNPVVSVLNIDIPLDAGFSKYKIYSMSGKVVLTGELIEGTSQIDMTSAKKGLYFIEIENSYGKVSKRISVE